MSGGTERGASQPVAAQMLHARGEREGRRVDGGRGGVLQAPPAARRARAPAAHARRVLLSSHADLFYCLFALPTLHDTLQFTLYLYFKLYTLSLITKYTLHFWELLVTLLRVFCINTLAMHICKCITLHDTLQFNLDFKLHFTFWDVLVTLLTVFCICTSSYANLQVHNITRYFTDYTLRFGDCTDNVLDTHLQLCRPALHYTILFSSH